MQVEQYPYEHPFYFNCCLLSSFASEDERIVVGARGYRGSYIYTDVHLQFRSIRDVKYKKNYLWYIRALSLLNIVINGQRLTDDARKEKFVKFH